MAKNHYSALSRRRFLGTCGTTAAAALLSVHAAKGAEHTGSFRAGIAVADMTPPVGTSMAGHFTDRMNTGAHDPIQARCLVLDNGAHRLALVTVDNCLVPRAPFDAAKARIQKETGIPPAYVITSATHTHTGPTATPVFMSDPVPGYCDFMAEKIAEGVNEAVSKLEPAQIAFGCGSVPGEVFNRRWFVQPDSIPENPFGEKTDRVRMNPPQADASLIEPSGPTDPAVPFIALRRPDGSPLAVYANYALHYVGGTSGLELSADYFACFAESLKKMLVPEESGKPFLALLSNGASGNINNINFREPGKSYEPYEKMQMVADNVAKEVFDRYQELQFVDHAPLGAAVRDLTLGVRRPTEDEVIRARRILEEAGDQPLRAAKEIYARETLFMADYPDTVSIPLQALRIGDVGIAAIPCEVFVEIGLAIKADSPLPLTFPVALANAYHGYLPTAEHHALGGYETWRARSSYLEVAAAEHIRKASLELLEKVKA
ncbi:MAG TPA: twin-arginine translocation signal domain-containing protein [Candidatus Hydrogenedentes bacterium]|mgnify:FL=1|nr:twin-arginine translocation signal domain-containing protein [Candidatus Hydrogenedentota bacterium]HOM47544.1 twin-arginine translocation signal domain-containing protein [Candidatus Hydrogenedentota bacterium]HPK25699.1 twin-arginine translocation signal domain-containing protein [Candidatus Hydrogenedentota bacterium]